MIVQVPAPTTCSWPATIVQTRRLARVDNRQARGGGRTEIRISIAERTPEGAVKVIVWSALPDRERPLLEGAAI